MRLAGQLPAQLPVPVARRAGARLRRPDLARGVQAAEAQGLPPTDSIGQAGVESTYDTYLRGKDGKAQLTVDSRGRPKGAARLEAQPTPGEALRLTIDIKLQRAAERALRYGIQLARAAASKARTPTAARSSRSTRSDGAVLAMASYPTYQPSIYVGRKDPKKLAPLLDPKVAPRRRTTRASTARSTPRIRPARRSSR